ncbi:MAG: (p)ppGpp synthetase [Acholeplasmatales bacterium]|jgi:putative GTP pyrophosphokinase|nr:(p)ppGpp synthetase [Acholeplasmatales bacterium]MBR6288377.1 (p)ppGpp synthetase [Acholeplasmatales bacterium]
MILQKEIQVNAYFDTDYNDPASVAVMEEYSKIEKVYRYALREMCAKLENLDDYCSVSLSHNPIHNIESRIKTKKSIIEKIHRRGYPVTIRTLKDLIYDIAGVRVVCNYIDDIDVIIELLMQQKNLRIRLRKDYISNPKPTGYRSVHIVFEKQMFLEDEEIWTPIEIQFRTIAMDMWASLEHELRYKSKMELSDDDKKKLKEYADKLYEIDVAMQKMYNENTKGEN